MSDFLVLTEADAWQLVGGGILIGIGLMGLVMEAVRKAAMWLRRRPCKKA